jgi:hypothetical protein
LCDEWHFEKILDSWSFCWVFGQALTDEILELRRMTGGKIGRLLARNEGNELQRMNVVIRRLASSHLKAGNTN